MFAAVRGNRVWTYPAVGCGPVRVTSLAYFLQVLPTRPVVRGLSSVLLLENRMRRLMILFGLLDFGIVATFAIRIPRLIHGLAEHPWVSAACLIMIASLCASAYGLIRIREWALVLNYVQFPVRLLLAFLSFGWLAQLVLPAHPSILVNEMVWGSAVAVEGIRLGITIILHFSGRGQQHNPPLLWIGSRRVAA
jgi:hypothetical protein